MSAPAIEARIDPVSLRRVLTDAKAFDKVLARALRARLRLAGAAAVEDVKRTVLESTPDGGGDNEGVRQALADATKVSIVASKRAEGVRIVTTSARLAAAHKAMLKAYNKASWRHPTRSGTAWVTQHGRPYFGAVINARKLEMRAAVNAALVEASETMKG